MGVFSSAPDSNSSYARAKANLPVKTESVGKKEKYGTSNAMLQMDDFLSLARTPPPQKSAPAKVVPKPEPAKVEPAKPEEPAATVQKEDIEESLSNKTDSVGGSENGDATKPKKKVDRNAVLAPKPKPENTKKKERYLKKKKEEEEAAERKKIEEAERLAAEAAKLAIKEKTPEPEPEPVKEERRLNEIVQEYMALAPYNCKYRARNSELMNIVHDLVVYDRSVNDLKCGKGKEDKAFIKLEENLTKCLIRFDNIERCNEVVIATRKQLIDFTQKLITKLETKAMDTSAPVVEAPSKKKPVAEKKAAEKKADEKKVEEAAVEVEDIKVEEVAKADENPAENSNAGLSVEEILRKKGKMKKKNKK